jgi:hypothetical protein
LIQPAQRWSASAVARPIRTQAASPSLWGSKSGPRTIAGSIRFSARESRCHGGSGKEKGRHMERFRGSPVARTPRQCFSSTHHHRRVARFRPRTPSSLHERLEACGRVQATLRFDCDICRAGSGEPHQGVRSRVVVCADNSIDAYFVISASRLMYSVGGRARERHFWNSKSSCLLSSETSPEEISKPHNSSMILVTRRVLTPSAYMVAMADLRERSVQEPHSSKEEEKTEELSRT